MPKRKTPNEPTWYWIEGLTKIAGVKRWIALYNARDPQQAETTIRMIRHQLANPPKDPSKSQALELASLKRYRDFRVMGDHLPDVRCSECGSNYLKRIKRGDLRLWKCRNCGSTWERVTKSVNESPSEASRKPSKGRKRPETGNGALKGKKKAQNASERPVPKSKKGRKTRTRG